MTTIVSITCYSAASGSMETSIIATSWEVAGGGGGAIHAGDYGGWSMPKQIGMPSLRWRRVPR